MQEINPSHRIRRMFEKVHRSYRLVNHILTLGMDRVWRRRAAGMAPEAPAGRWLDACSGTGDMAARLKAAAPEGTEIFAVDFTREMVETARKDPRLQDVLFALGDAAKLPFADESFSLLAVSFSTRNMNLAEGALEEVFREFLRVLCPGGVFLNLETSQPPSSLARRLFHIAVSWLVGPAGRLISGNGPAYRYLSRSIARFYTAEELASIIDRAGFSDVEFRRYSLGAVALHKAVRAADR